MMLVLSYLKEKIYVLFVVMVLAMILDLCFGRISELVGKQYYFSWGIMFFLFISILAIAGQYLILQFVKKNISTLEQTKVLRFKRIHTLVTIVQIFLTTVFIFLTFQLIYYNHYNTILIIITVTTGYAMAIAIFGFVAFSLFLWYNQYRNNIIVLLYAVAISIICVNSISSVIYLDKALLERPPEIWNRSYNNFEQFVPGSINYYLNNFYTYSLILSFVSIWISTFYMLRHFMDRIGRTKFLILITVPLIYFLSQFFTLSFNFIKPMILSDPFFYSILFTQIFTVSKLIGGILFGIAFWTIIKTIPKSYSIRNYLIISAFGMTFIFVIGETSIIQAPYPPFGIATISFVGLTSYLVFIGIYFSAISITFDTQLREEIRKHIEGQFSLLDSIGTAKRNLEIQKTTLKVVEKQAKLLEEEVGLKVTDNELSEYMEEVMKELKQYKASQKG